MTEPMTPARLEEIRAAHARDRYEPYSDDVRVLLAEVERLRALPVLRTCSDCHWPDLSGGLAACGYPGAGGFDISGHDEPPTVCPLRGGER